MQLNKFIDGLKILQCYFDNPNGYHIGAEHDIFYVYATNRPVSDDDLVKLKDLGWFQPEALDGENPPYDPQEGWGAHT